MALASAPLVSVIIPMYNAEKYITQCLDSLLTQTFKDYEVIVVDDCSTDRSIEIVEKIAEQRGNGKIHLIKNKKNSGGSAIPRNVGLRYSHGKYIAFCDNDDMFTTTALEELVTIAERMQADVLHMEKFLILNDFQPGVDVNRKITVTSWANGPFVTKPESVTADIGERVVLFSQKRLYWHVWSKLFRRDFITKNCLEFPDLKIADDMLFSFFCICLAKNYIRIPNIVNLYRYRRDSTSNNAASVEEKFCQIFRIIIEGTKLLDKFMDGLDFFIKHKEFKHIAIDFFVQDHVGQTIGLCIQRPPHIIEDLMHREFAEEMGENSELISYIFNRMNVLQFQMFHQRNTIKSLQNQNGELKKLMGK